MPVAMQRLGAKPAVSSRRSAVRVQAAASWLPGSKAPAHLETPMAKALAGNFGAQPGLPALP
jgi:hypothetical protein